MAGDSRNYGPPGARIAALEAEVERLHSRRWHWETRAVSAEAEVERLRAGHLLACDVLQKEQPGDTGPKPCNCEPYRLADMAAERDARLQAVVDAARFVSNWMHAAVEAADKQDTVMLDWLGAFCDTLMPRLDVALSELDKEGRTGSSRRECSGDHPLLR